MTILLTTLRMQEITSDCRHAAEMAAVFVTVKDTEALGFHSAINSNVALITKYVKLDNSRHNSKSWLPQKFFKWEMTVNK